MMWPCFAPSNQTVWTPPHKNSPSDLHEPWTGETLESQEEYPWEEVEEVEAEVEEAEEAVEDSHLQYLRHKHQIQETNSSAIHHSCLQETAPNQKHS